MIRYDKKTESADKERILRALDVLNELRKKYQDVVAIPEVVTLHDITEYRLDTSRGPREFKQIYDRKTAVAVLEYFAGNDYISPEHFENTIVYALQELPKTKDRRG